MEMLDKPRNRVNEADLVIVEFGPAEDPANCGGCGPCDDGYSDAREDEVMRDRYLVKHRSRGQSA